MDVDRPTVLLDEELDPLGSFVRERLDLLPRQSIPLLSLSGVFPELEEPEADPIGVRLFDHPAQLRERPEVAVSGAFRQPDLIGEFRDPRSVQPLESRRMAKAFSVVFTRFPAGSFDTMFDRTVDGRAYISFVPFEHAGVLVPVAGRSALIRRPDTVGITPSNECWGDVGDRRDADPGESTCRCSMVTIVPATGSGGNRDSCPCRAECGRRDRPLAPDTP